MDEEVVRRLNFTPTSVSLVKGSWRYRNVLDTSEARSFEHKAASIGQGGIRLQRQCTWHRVCRLAVGSPGDSALHMVYMCCNIYAIVPDWRRTNCYCYMVVIYNESVIRGIAEHSHRRFISLWQLFNFCVVSSDFDFSGQTDFRNSWSWKYKRFKCDLWLLLRFYEIWPQLATLFSGVYFLQMHLRAICWQQFKIMLKNFWLLMNNNFQCSNVCLFKFLKLLRML